MINGAHVVVYSKDAEADRNFDRRDSDPLGEERTNIFASMGILLTSSPHF